MRVHAASGRDAFWVREHGSTKFSPSTTGKAKQAHHERVRLQILALSGGTRILDHQASSTAWTSRPAHALLARASFPLPLGLGTNMLRDMGGHNVLITGECRLFGASGGSAWPAGLPHHQ
jgi:hypothetical protein